jgi:hypothetical protein
VYDRKRKVDRELKERVVVVANGRKQPHALYVKCAINQRFRNRRMRLTFFFIFGMQAFVPPFSIPLFFPRKCERGRNRIN